MIVPSKCSFSRFAPIPCHPLDGQHQGVGLWKGLILDVAGNFEPLATIFNEASHLSPILPVPLTKHNV